MLTPLRRGFFIARNRRPATNSAATSHGIARGHAPSLQPVHIAFTLAT